MYRLSKDVDLSFLEDIELQQVCIGRNEVILNFDEDVRMALLSSFAVSPLQGGPAVTYTDAVKGGRAILAIVQDRVARAEATHEGGLLLSFASGATIMIFDDSESYESFWIRHGEEQIVV